MQRDFGRPDLWEQVRQTMRGQVDPRDFDTWLAPLTMRLEADWAVISAPNRFFVDWVRDHYLSQLEQVISQCAARPLGLRFETDAGPVPTPPTSTRPAFFAPAPAAAATTPAQPTLKPGYTFETFIVGACNELAHAACRAVAQQPGRQYNPLLIFGGAGLGKTHLLHAVGNAFYQRDPRAKVLYTTCEAFTNELIQAVRFDSIGRFQEKYRGLDCLLLDDIQFLAGRERTQEELFHTFNALQESGGQIVLTSDDPPRELQGVVKRLRTRFEGGLTADLQPPPSEIMVAILQSKAQAKGMDLSDQVAMFLARQPEGNVRVLEGYLNRIIAVSRFQGVEVTLELARRVVGPLMAQRQVSVEEVLQTVAARYGVRVGELKSSRKTRDVTRPRQVAMFLARQLTGQSYPEIGRALGGKDHSTVVKGVKKIQGQMAREAALAEEIRTLERELLEGGETPVD